MNKKNYLNLNIEQVIPVLAQTIFKSEFIIVISKENLYFSLNILKNHFNFRYRLLSCISGIDLLNLKYRFCVSYDLLSLTFNTRLRVKIFFEELSSIVSTVNIFINANWWEREIWDLFGIFFENHKDLRRILTDYGFDGHPMRKDFPLSGYLELRYVEKKRRIISERVLLDQEFRIFSFETPW